LIFVLVHELIVKASDVPDVIVLIEHLGDVGEKSVVCQEIVGAEQDDILAP
jgi:hypothetical protein